MSSPRRAFLHLVACVSISLGAALSELWAIGPRHRRGVRRLEISLDLQRLEAQIRILSAWFRRCKHRPRYPRRQWLLILEHAERFSLGATQTARDFLVSVAAVHRWRKRRREGRLAALPLKPLPPCRRIADSRRELVATMARKGFEGDRTIARHLALQGEAISPRSVARFREKPLGPLKQPDKQEGKWIREGADLVEACAAHLGPQPGVRPRLARLLRGLADALTEGIASDTLARIDEGSPYEEKHALMRSRRAEQLALLHARASRLPPRHRPRFTEAERAEILTLKYRFRLSHRTTAAWFLLHPGTLSEWMADVEHPQQRLRPLVEPIADLDTVLARVAQDLPPVPRRLKDKVAQTLATLAARVPMRKRGGRPRSKTRNRARAAARPRELSTIRAQHRNHFWSADLTTVELGRRFHLAAIIDLFSRDVLAWGLFARKPGSGRIKALFEQALARYGPPERFVTDQGQEFRRFFKRALDRRGIEHRKGAVGQSGSIALIERLWRTAKEALDLKAVRPNVPALVYERVAVVIDYYRTKRPHSALCNATPAQVYRGESSRAHEVQPAPRGWRGQASPPVPFAIRHAFPAEKKLPYLERLA